MWVFEYLFLMLIESINQICLKLHSSDLNLHMFACRVPMWWGSKGALFWHMEGVSTTTWGLNYLDVFKEKKPKCHYIQNYDLWEESLKFQNLEFSTTLVERENLFCIIGILLYDVIPTQVVITFCGKAQWLDVKQLSIPLLSVLWGDYIRRYICYRWRKKCKVYF
jgi:hypothetical protein